MPQKGVVCEEAQRLSGPERTQLATDAAWSKTDLGEALLSTAVDVFVSPVHVLETMQAKETVRTALAETMLALCDARRMWPSYEFIVADYFFRALTHRRSRIRDQDARTSRLPQGLEHADLPGCAGHPRARPPGIPSAIVDVRRAKLINQVLHSRAASDPKKWLANLLECTAKCS